MYDQLVNNTKDRMKHTIVIMNSYFLLMTHLMSPPTHWLIVFSLLLYKPTCVFSLRITNSSRIQPLF